MNIIKFPGAQPISDEKPGPTLTEEQAGMIERMPPGNPTEYLPTVDGTKLKPDQAKAIALVLGGYNFILVAVEPTQQGADFFTALHGDHADMRNALPHLDDVIRRLYLRKGI